MYHCQACKLKVIVIGEKVIKACKCDAPVVAELVATMAGKGEVSH